MKTVFKERVKKLLGLGLDQHHLSLAACLGVTIGAAPLVWGTSLLCILFAFVFRLNQVAVQCANYLAWPLQILFFYPYFSSGIKLAGNDESIHAEQFSGLLAAGPAEFFTALAGNNVWALLVWLLTAPLIAISSYGITRFLIRFGRNLKTENSSASNRFLTRTV
jgi:hypothetical protein